MNRIVNKYEYVYDYMLNSNKLHLYFLFEMCSFHPAKYEKFLVIYKVFL